MSFFLVFVWIQNSQGGRQVSLEFEEVDGGVKYELVFTRKNGPALRHITKEPSWSGSLPVGVYEMRTRSFDDRGVAGPWSEPVELLVKSPPPELRTPLRGERVQSDEPENGKITFTWGVSEGAAGYRFSIKELGIQKDVSETQVSIELPVAKTYSWQVQALMPGGEPGEVQDDRPEFTFFGAKLHAPEIKPVFSRYIQNLTWKMPKWGDESQLELQHESHGRWRTLKKLSQWREAQLEIPKRFPGGKYRFRVQASAEKRMSSAWSEIEFELASGDRSPAAAKAAELRESLALPKSYYLIASYLVTGMNYSSVNREEATQANYNAVGGTGRIGMGYVPPNQSRGYFGIVDLSGFSVNSKNFTFASSELHITYRKYFGNSLIRGGGGLFYKELPETRGQEGGSVSTSTLAVLGPHVGVDYWRPFTNQLGLQMNSRVYYNLQGVRTPNGRGSEPTFSYQFGVLGSYRLGADTLGFLGYAYRRDQISYRATPASEDRTFTSFANDGEKNTVTIEGHYLNLLLEWGF